MGFFVKERRKAVAYYRHSAEDKQEYSVPIQREHARRFATLHDIDIIHEEADEGKTGLLANRPGFQRLLNDWVLNPNAPPFDYVFVFDVSRWGRFQETDESGHYEYLVKKSGKTVVYVPRGIPQEENKLAYSLQTTLERHMAAEYSAVLSRKVFYGSVNVSRKGFSAGGSPPYGLGRLLLDEQRRPIQLLRQGERKMISNQRVTFQPLNDGATKNVQEIFVRFIHHEQSLDVIAQQFNARSIPSPGGCRWKRSTVRHILDNENYLGIKVYNKTWGRLQNKRRVNPRNEWILCPNAFPAVVSADLFLAAQKKLQFVIPHRRNKGVALIRKIERILVLELFELLERQRLKTNNHPYAERRLPFVFSIRQHGCTGRRWFFQIPRYLETHKSVIAFGLTPEIHVPIEQIIECVFRIPISDFGPFRVISFSEQDTCFRRYLIDVDQARKHVLWSQHVE